MRRGYFYLITIVGVVVFAGSILAQSTAPSGTAPSGIAPGDIVASPSAPETSTATDTDPSAVIAIEDPDALRAEIRRLRGRLKSVVGERDSLASERDSLNTKIGEMTHPGGSLVTAYCAEPTLSRNTSGAEDRCSVGGYTCNAVSGLCRTSCESTEHCAPSFACDIPAGKCVHY